MGDLVIGQNFEMMKAMFIDYTALKNARSRIL